VEAFAHQDLPFERVVELAGVARDPSRHPITQVSVDWHDTAIPVEVPGLDIEAVPLRSLTAKTDLRLGLFDDGQGLSAVFEYSTAALDEGVVRGIADLLVRLAGVVAAEEGPDRRLSELAAAAGTGAPRPTGDRAAPAVGPGGLVHELIASVARRVPDAVAVEDAGGVLSYGELAARADRLAEVLRGAGVGPESVVGVCLPRGSAVVVALLAVLKAGGAYLPLDPGFPAGRLREVVADAGAGVVVADGQGGWLPGYGGVVVGVDDDPPPGGGGGGAGPVAGQGNLAYVIYTSGSTGKPKGVMVSHASLANYLRWACQTYCAEPGWGAALITPVAYDLAVTSLFLPLLTGQRLYLAPDLLDGAAPREVLGNRPGASFVKLTPSHLAILADAWQQDALPPDLVPDTVVVGGEAFVWPGMAAAPWARESMRVVNEYGPTEGTVANSACIARAADLAPGPVPIGRPIAGAVIYLLDRHQGEVPAGVTGEIYIGGPGVARGYLGQPGLTAERFVPDPFSGVPGARLYRTGDLARCRADGSIEYVGRMDAQIKFHSYRIEAAEIRAAVLAEPGLLDCEVVVSGTGSDAALCAFLVLAESGAAFDPVALRDQLRGILPRYMVPAVFVPVPRIPLTPNHKVDRERLAELAAEHRRRTAGTRQAPALSPAEREIAEIFEQVIGSEVRADDNFFDLGGDSISAMKISSRLKRTGLPVRPRDIFRHQTVRELARFLGGTDQPEAVTPEAVTLRAARPRVLSARLSPVQEWFFEFADRGAGQYVSLLDYEIAPQAADRDVTAAVEATATGHEAFRLRFVRQAGDWRQELDPAARPELTVSDLTGLDGAAQGRAVEQATRHLGRAFDLRRGGLLRAAFFQLGPDQPGRLTLAAHHLVVDAVSWSIVQADLEAALGSGQAGPAEDVPWLDWVAGLTGPGRSGDLLQAAEYWSAQTWLSAPQYLPADAGHWPDVHADQDAVEHALPRGAASLVLDRAAAASVRLDAVLLGALAAVITDWSNAADLRIDVEGHGREPFAEQDPSRTVGWFTCLFPVVASGVEAMDRQLRSAPHAGASFGLLTSAGFGQLGLKPRPARIRFNFLGRFSGEQGRLVTPAGQGMRLHADGRMRRPHEFAITCYLADSELRFHWAFSSRRHRRQVVEDLMAEFIARLVAWPEERQ
jgi:amino acid adenylation domain-containing protein/non-ribosomal peptide synthase protein (TIGR01720 family)